MQQNQEPLNSLCIVRLSAIGDVCHAVATLQSIQRTMPDLTISWIIGRVEHALIGDLPGVEFIVFDKNRGFKAYLELRRALQERAPFDALLQMQTSTRQSGGRDDSSASQDRLSRRARQRSYTVFS